MAKKFIKNILSIMEAFTKIVYIYEVLPIIQTLLIGVYGMLCYKFTNSFVVY